MVERWRKGECRLESARKRRLRAWEEEEWGRLEHTLEGISLTTQDDHLIWSNSGKEYNVAEGYKLLSRSNGKELIWNKI